MLVLSRKLNQSIEIGPGIEIVVVKVQGDRVRLGIQAPQDVAIRRSELGSLDATRTGLKAESP